MSRFIQHTLLFGIGARHWHRSAAKYLVRVNLHFVSSFAPIPALADFYDHQYSEYRRGVWDVQRSGRHLHRRRHFSFGRDCILLSPHSRRSISHPPRARLAVGRGARQIDRLLYGTVTDFIFFHWYDQLNAPIFNVADLSITIGVIILAYLMLLEHLEERRAAIRADAVTASSASPTSATHD